MRSGAQVLGIPFPEEAKIAEATLNAVTESNISDTNVKICLLSHGRSVFFEKPERSSLLAIVRGYQQPKESVKLCVSSIARNSTSPVSRIKSLNYLENVIAKREALARVFDESLFLNEQGNIAECSTCNIFWFSQNILYTPAIECGLLPGVSRSVLIDIATELGIEVKEGRFDLNDLLSSDCAFVTNSSIGASAIKGIDQISLSYSSQEFIRIKDALFEKLLWY